MNNESRIAVIHPLKCYPVTSTYSLYPERFVKTLTNMVLKYHLIIVEQQKYMVESYVTRVKT